MHVRVHDMDSIAAPISPRTMQKAVPRDGALTKAALPNYLFQTNQITLPSTPALFVREVHTYWAKNYEMLETRHDYVQWLFPIYVASQYNDASFALQRTEARQLRQDIEANLHFVFSYMLFLDFLGLQLADFCTGEIKRAPHWQARFANVLEHPHNLKRITRVIQSLGQLGFARWKAPLVNCLQTQIQRGRFTPSAVWSIERTTNYKELYETPDALVTALNSFWLPLLNPTTAWYSKHTHELKEDDTDVCAILLTHLDRADALGNEYLKLLEEYRVFLTEDL